MNRLFKSWESGKILRPDIAMPPIRRPDGSLYDPYQGRLFYYTYKTHQLSMIETFGDIYYNGCQKAGIVSDKNTALEMYARAALNHVPSAQFKLGKMWYDGDGVEKNETTGLLWITSAALEGSTPAAQFLLSINEEAPNPISPNSYAVAALEAKSIHEGLKQAERVRLVSDLANLGVKEGLIKVL